MTEPTPEDRVVRLLCDLVIYGIAVDLNTRGDGLDIHLGRNKLSPECQLMIEANARRILAFLKEEDREMRDLTRELSDSQRPGSMGLTS